MADVKYRVMPSYIRRPGSCVERVAASTALLLQHCLEGLDRVGLGGTLVEAVSLHPGEAEGDAARVTGAGLDAVDGNFDHLFGAQVDRPSCPG